MATKTSHNKNNSAVKRIMQEARELQNDPSTDYTAAPTEENIFEWHCTLRGPPGTEFEGGLYHFRISLPSEYPFRPPSIIMLTPSGRFELGTKICISFTNYHEELWQPAWGIRTAIIGLQGFFPLKGKAAVGVGSMEASPAERKRLAKLSRSWVCPDCKVSNLELLPDPTTTSKESSHDAPCDKSGESESSPATRPSGSGGVVAADGSVAPIEAANLPANSGPSAVSIISDPSPGNLNSHDRDEKQAEHSSGNSNTAETRSSLVKEAMEGGARSPSASVQSASRKAPSPSARPPVVLDVAIVSLVVLLVALLCRKLF